jgi:hypothetical protein
VRYDYQDGQLIRKKTTSRLGKAGDVAGFFDKKIGYLRVGIRGKHYLVHRIIFMMHNGYMPEEADHINGNKLDNRIENLRSASKSENLRNRASNKNNQSGYKNVAWHKQHKKWSVTLNYDGSKHHIGYFEDLELADLVAQEARDKYHKQFSYKGY